MAMTAVRRAVVKAAAGFVASVTTRAVAAEAGIVASAKSATALRRGPLLLRGRSDDGPVRNLYLGSSPSMVCILMLCSV